MAFLYFAPGGEHPITKERAADLGVGYAFDANPASVRIEGRTPTGGPGWLFCRPEAMGELQIAYRGDAQRWKQIQGRDVWLGWYADSPPREASLARLEQRDGYQVTLANGEKWRIPILRFFLGEAGFQSALPHYAELDENGEWIAGEVLEDFRELDAIASRLYEGMVESLLDGNRSLPLSGTELLTMAHQLLTTNYYVSDAEISALHLLILDPSYRQLHAIARAAMDFDRAEAWAQKKTQEKFPAVSTG